MGFLAELIRNNMHKQSGQTLIETIAAIFILTTTLTAGLALTIYILANSDQTFSEITATNLAREGVDVIKNMRDSNWLAGESGLIDCTDIGTKCYPGAFNTPAYDITSVANINKRIVFDPTALSWSLDTVADYNLYLQANGTYLHNVSSNSTFARMINLSLDSSAPFTAANPELIVKSVVAWRGRKCPSFATNQDLLAFNSPCKTVVEQRLTNWKDYK